MKKQAFSWLIKIAIIQVLVLTGLMVFYPRPVVVVADKVLIESVDDNAEDIKHIEKVIGRRVIDIK